MSNELMKMNVQTQQEQQRGRFSTSFSLTFSGLEILLFLLLVMAPSQRGSVMAMCPDSCECDDVNLVVKCIDAGLEVMPNTLNPRLRTIIYKHNNFPSVDVSLMFLPHLDMIDLSHNQIVSIPSKVFDKQSVLVQLKLDNNKIGGIDNETFFGLRNLKSVSFRDNEISDLPANLFRYAKAVESIDLARNRIADVHESAFQGLDGLRVLHLEDNNIAGVPKVALRHLINLAELYMSGNPLGRISADAFSSLHSLTKLDLTSCHLRSLDDLAFAGLGTLRWLKMADNNLTEVPSISFRGTPNLHKLTLGRNPLSTLKANSFLPLAKLRSVDISGCSKLITVESGAFSGCVDLIRVTLSLNVALRRIEVGAFDVLPDIKKLDLSGNRLEGLPRSLVPWSRLSQLELSRNPWRCDCHLASFIPGVLKELRAKKNSSIIAGKCAEPPAMYGTSLHNLKDATDDCNGRSTNKEPPRLSHTGIAEGEGERSVEEESFSNTVAVVASVCVVCIVILLAAGLFVSHKCRQRHRDLDHFSGVPGSGRTSDWLKYKSRCTDSDSYHYPPPSSSCSPGSSAESSSTLRQNNLYVQQQQQHQLKHLREDCSSTLVRADDEYFYVSAASAPKMTSSSPPSSPSRQLHSPLRQQQLQDPRLHATVLNNTSRKGEIGSVFKSLQHQASRVPVTVL